MTPGSRIKLYFLRFLSKKNLGSRSGFSEKAGLRVQLKQIKNVAYAIELPGVVIAKPQKAVCHAAQVPEVLGPRVRPRAGSFGVHVDFGKNFCHLKRFPK